ncbi:MAG: MFS transporter [Gammaproteobacteria bacterium]
MLKKLDKRTIAIHFIILLGVVSFFADITFEGARSITGAYLALLGANAAMVGFIAGFGELVGYSLRIVFGYIVDKTMCHWIITLLGYGLNLVTVPLLALSSNWRIAALLIILERLGKAIRAPARDSMLSYASTRVGMGSGFGLHHALDQLGGMVGPLLITAVMFFKGGYQLSFALLAIPALISLFFLVIARRTYPKPEDLEPSNHHIIKKQGLTLPFWIYLVAGSAVAMGYADFPLVAYHFEKASVMHPFWIPLSYAAAMMTSSVASLFLGRIYDRMGYPILLVGVAISSFFAPLAFLGNATSAFFAMILWGLGMSVQSSLMKALIGNLVEKEHRASAYGIFNTCFGVAWFLGSACMGLLYDISILSMVIFSMAAQSLFIPCFIVAQRKTKNEL